MTRKHIAITAIAAAIIISGCSSWIKPIDVPEEEAPVGVTAVLETESEETEEVPEVRNVADIWAEQHPEEASAKEESIEEESEEEENVIDQSENESATERSEPEQSEEHEGSESGPESLSEPENSASESGSEPTETSEPVESEPVEEPSTEEAVSCTGPAEETYDLSQYEFKTMYGANANEINIRKGPGTEYKKMGHIGLGSVVQAARYNDGWYIVSHNDSAYFICADYLSEEDPTEVVVQSTSEVNTTPSTTVNTDYAAWNAVAESVLSDYEKQLIERCRAFEANGMSGSISGWNDATALANAYRDWTLNNLNPRTWSSNGSSLWLDSSSSDSRESIANLIINTYGVSASSDTFQTVRDTCARVRAKMKFSYGYIDTSTATSVRNGQGVCVQYSRIAYVLLNAEGIPTKMVGGKGPTGADHAWNQCYINGSWYTVDFCTFANGNISPDGFARSGYNYSEYDTLVF